MQEITAEQVKAGFARLQADPLYFFKEGLGIELWEKQIEIAEAVRDNERVVVQSCFGVGKTYVAASVALWFLYSFCPSKVVTTAPTGRQVKELLWAEIRKLHKAAKVDFPGDRPLTQHIKVDEDWFATGFSTREYDPDKFTGYHQDHVLVIFDQAAGVQKGIWESAEGLMTSAHVRWLAIGNCTDPRSEFAKACKPNSGWHPIKINAWESPNVRAGKNVYPGLISYDWPEKKKQQWGEDSMMYQIFVMGKFWTEGEDSLIPYALVEAMYDSSLTADGPTVIGLDVAEFGGDKTIWVVRVGPMITQIRYTEKEDTMQTVGRTVELIRELESPKVQVDRIGVGRGVFDRLAELGYDVEGVSVAESASEPKLYKNLRAELAFNLRQRFKDVDITMSPLIAGHIREQWEAEMIEPRFKINSAGQYVLEPKDETKKRLGHSPDFFDATMLAFADTGPGLQWIDMG